MDALLLNALDLAGVKGAQYADIRLVNTTQERLVVRNGVVDTLSNDQSTGFGVRVLVNGSWGFASSQDFSSAELDRVADLAVAVAKASTLQRKEPVDLGAQVTSRGTYTTPIQVDPFEISSQEKLNLLLKADQGMASVKGIRSRQGSLVFIREEKTFANTEGAYVEQTIYEAGGGVQATAVGSDEVQQRCYPQMNGRQQGCAGWEYIADLDIPGLAEKTASETVALLTAPHCPNDTITGGTSLMSGGQSSFFACGIEVVDWVSDHSVGDYGDPLLRNSLGVEGHGPAVQVTSVIPDRNQRTHSRFTHQTDHPASAVLDHLGAHSIGT